MSPALQDERSAPRHGIPRDRAAARSAVSATWAGLPDALHAEWTKLRTVSSTAWLLLVAIVVTIATGAIASSIVQCPGSCQADPAKISLTGVMLGQATIAVLAVLAMTSEYSTGMIRATLTAVPRRSTVLAAKAAVLTAVVLAAATIAVLGSVLAGELLLPGNGFSAAHGFGPLTLVHGPVLRAAAGSVLYFWLIAMLGLGVAAAVRESGVATTLVLGLLYVLPIIGSLILNPHWERRFQRYSPTDAGLAIQATRNLGKLPIGPWEGLGVLACWAAIAMLAGWSMLRWRDA
jgi:ABC-2 type transport system permease protein